MEELLLAQFLDFQLPDSTNAVNAQSWNKSRRENTVATKFGLKAINSAE